MLSDSENPQHLELREPPKAGRWKQSAPKRGEDGDGEAVAEADGAVDGIQTQSQRQAKMNVETEECSYIYVIVRKSEALEFHFSILGKHMYTC